MELEFFGIGKYTYIAH